MSQYKTALYIGYGALKTLKHTADSVDNIDMKTAKQTLRMLSRQYTTVLALIVVLSGLLMPQLLLAASPLTFTYQGRLTNGSGTAITENSVVLRFRILNTAGDCILYSETQTINTSSTGGTFSLEIGSDNSGGVGFSKRIATEDRSNSMAAVFSNSGIAIPGKQLSSPTTNCAMDYTPTTTDDRKLQITVVSTTSQPTLDLVLTPLQRITGVPYATVAQTLDGYTSSQFLRLSGAAVSPTARVTAGNFNTLMDRLFTTQATGYDRLDDLLTNWGSNISISSNNLNVNSNKITNLATPTAGGDAVNKTYSDGYVGGQASSGLGALAGGDSGKALVWNGTNWVAQTVSSLPAQATHSGKFLTTDGTTASWASTGTVTSATATAPLEISGTVTTAPNVRFVAGTALNDSYVLTITNGNQPAFVNSGGLYVLKGGQTGALSLGTTDATDLTLLTGNSPEVTVKSGGKVGIGTTAPARVLSVSSKGNNGSYASSSAMATTPVGSTQPSILVQSQTMGDSYGHYIEFLGYNSSAVGQYAYIGSVTTAGGGYQPSIVFGTQTGANAYAERVRIDQNGYVGINTTSPRGQLDVAGTILAKPAVLNSTATIDWGTGNLQYTNSDCGAFQLHNMKDGGSYMFVVKGTNSATCSFNAFSDGGSTALTVRLPPDHGATIATDHTVYNFTVLGSDVYIAWTPGY